MALWLPAMLFGDQVTLKNGDRITGKIVKKDGGKLTVKSDLLGEVSMAWDAVTGARSDEPIVVVLPDGKTVTGKVETVEGRLQVGDARASLGDVKAMRNADEQKAFERLEAPRWRDLWAGYIDTGFSLARGNARANTLTTAFNAARATRTDKTTLYFNQIYATARVNDVVSETAEARRGGWAYNRNVSSKLFVNLFNDYESDRFQSLDLRFVLGTGLGYSAIKSERTRLDLLGGAAYNREKFFTNTRNSAEAYWGDDWTYALSGVTSFRQSFRMFNNLSDRGAYRINFDIGTVTTIHKWLGWQVTASDRYLSNPVPGRRKNDLLLSTGLRISFAR